MRKHPLIALTAFTALSASAIAGISTGNLGSNAVLSSARANRPSVTSNTSNTSSEMTAAEVTAYFGRPSRRNLSVMHDPRRPERMRLNSVTGLPAIATHKLKPRHVAVIEATTQTEVPYSAPTPAPAPVYTPPPTTVPTTTAPAAAPSGGVWYELRLCESGDNYAEDTGNGYYGAYQFALSTWYGLGFTGLPSDAAPAVQDRAAEELQAESGWGQWPSCSAAIGL